MPHHEYPHENYISGSSAITDVAEVIGIRQRAANKLGGDAAFAWATGLPVDAYRGLASLDLMRK